MTQKEIYQAYIKTLTTDKEYIVLCKKYNIKPNIVLNTSEELNKLFDGDFSACAEAATNSKYSSNDKYVIFDRDKKVLISSNNVKKLIDPEYVVRVMEERHVTAFNYREEFEKLCIIIDAIREEEKKEMET